MPHIIGATALIVATLVSPAAALEESDPLSGGNDSPVEISAPEEDFSNVVDQEGELLEIIDSQGEGTDEHIAVALTSDDDPVVMTNLLAPMEGEPVSDAPEPGPDGWEWEKGVSFTENEPTPDTETTPIDEIPEIDPASLEIAISTATTATSFSAAWPVSPGSMYEISRDGSPLGTTEEGSFTDGTLTPSETHTYVARSVSGADIGAEKTFQASALPADAGDIVETTESPVAALAIKVKPTAGWFVYNTFITDKSLGMDLLKKVGGECEGALSDRYGGDNRGFVKPSLHADPWSNASHRTGVRVKADFGASTPIVIKNRHVGETRRYNSAGKFIAKRTASDTGIVFSEEAKSANLYRLKISHTVGNPFCKKGAIRYTVYLKIWNSGVMSVNGSRQPVPAHEAYGLFTNSNASQQWVTMYRGNQGDFFCISGLCPSQTISKTHTPG